MGVCTFVFEAGQQKTLKNFADSLHLQFSHTPKGMTGYCE